MTRFDPHQARRVSEGTPRRRVSEEPGRPAGAPKPASRLTGGTQVGKFLVNRLALAGVVSVVLAAPGCLSGPSMTASRTVATGSMAAKAAPRVAGLNAQGVNPPAPGTASKLTSTVKDSAIGKTVTSAFKKT